MLIRKMIRLLVFWSVFVCWDGNTNWRLLVSEGLLHLHSTLPFLFLTSCLILSFFSLTLLYHLKRADRSPFVSGSLQPNYEHARLASL